MRFSKIDIVICIYNHTTHNIVSTIGCMPQHIMKLFGRFENEKEKVCLFLMYMMKLLGWFEMGIKNHTQILLDHFFLAKGEMAHIEQFWWHWQWSYVKTWGATSWLSNEEPNLAWIWYDFTTVVFKARKWATKSPFILQRDWLRTILERQDFFIKTYELHLFAINMNLNNLFFLIHYGFEILSIYFLQNILKFSIERHKFNNQFSL